MGREGGPSAEEMGLKPEETRILSDAELIKGGARIKADGRLEVTKEQVGKAREEMAAEKAREFREKAPQAKAALAEFESRVREYWTKERSAGSLLALEHLTDGIPQQSKKLEQLVREVSQLYIDSGGALTHEDEAAFEEVQRPYALLKKISA